MSAALAAEVDRSGRAADEPRRVEARASWQAAGEARRGLCPRPGKGQRPLHPALWFAFSLRLGMGWPRRGLRIVPGLRTSSPGRGAAAEPARHRARAVPAVPVAWLRQTPLTSRFLFCISKCWHRRECSTCRPACGRGESADRSCSHASDCCASALASDAPRCDPDTHSDRRFDPAREGFMARPCLDQRAIYRDMLVRLAVTCQRSSGRSCVGRVDGPSNRRPSADGAGRVWPPRCGPGQRPGLPTSSLARGRPRQIPAGGCRANHPSPALPSSTARARRRHRWRRRPGRG